MTVSLVVLAKNEAGNIEDCLDSASGVDEIVVVDDHSEDATAALARSRGARVVSRKLDNFSAQLNFGAREAEGDWIFILDADERFSPGLLSSIREHMARPGPQAAGTVTRKNFALGQRHRFGVLRPDRVPRLFPRGRIRWEGLVHSQLHFDLPQKPLNGYLTHYTYKDWAHYFRKFDHYTTLWAQNAHHRGLSVSQPEIWIRFAWSQFKMFGLNSGLLGGPTAWALCFFHGGYTLAKYFKLLELNRTQNG